MTQYSDSWHGTLCNEREIFVHSLHHFCSSMVDRWSCLGRFKDEKNLKNYFLARQLFFRISRSRFLSKSTIKYYPPPSYRSEQNIQSHCIVRPWQFAILSKKPDDSASYFLEHSGQRASISMFFFLLKEKKQVFIENFPFEVNINKNDSF